MAGPLDMIVNHEMLNVVLAHLSTPAQVDGDCGNPECTDVMGEHGADHIINELVKHFGFPWKRVYDKDIDGVFPPSWCEDAAKIREKLTTDLRRSARSAGEGAGYRAGDGAVMGTEQNILPEPSEQAKLLVRFKNWLQNEGQYVGDTDAETAEIFLRNDAIRQSVDDAVDPRFTKGQ